MPSQKQKISIGNSTRILNEHPIAASIFFITVKITETITSTKLA
jgi:hypothetical protein